jgi:hypothetical protein
MSYLGAALGIDALNKVPSDMIIFKVIRLLV